MKILKVSALVLAFAMAAGAGAGAMWMRDKKKLVAYSSGYTNAQIAMYAAQFQAAKLEKEVSADNDKISGLQHDLKVSRDDYQNAVDYAADQQGQKEQIEQEKQNLIHGTANFIARQSNQLQACNAQLQQAAAQIQQSQQNGQMNSQAAGVAIAIIKALLR